MNISLLNSFIRLAAYRMFYEYSFLLHKISCKAASLFVHSQTRAELPFLRSHQNHKSDIFYADSGFLVMLIVLRLGFSN